MCAFGAVDIILYIVQGKYYGVNIITWTCSVNIILLILSCGYVSADNVLWIL
jgi:hypothetical protein